MLTVPCFCVVIALQGKRLVNVDGVEEINDMFQENTMMQAENNKLRQRIRALQETIETLTKRNAELIAQKDAMVISNTGSECSGLVYWVFLAVSDFLIVDFATIF